MSCKKLTYEKEEVTIKVKTSIVDCEEENIHLKIIEAEDSTLVDIPILPVCKQDSVCEKEFYNMSDTTKVYVIKGYFSKQSHNYLEYGCYDTKAILITHFEPKNNYVE